MRAIPAKIYPPCIPSNLSTDQLCTYVSRFWNRVVKKDHGCWEWTAYKSGGYGRFRVKGRWVLSHRFSYELLRGPIPPALQMDHLCRNRACVNPNHLEAVTRKVNLLRGESIWAINSRKTSCVRGHAFDELNTYLAKQGSMVVRQCKECVRIRMKRYRNRSSTRQRGTE